MRRRTTASAGESRRSLPPASRSGLTASLRASLPARRTRDARLVAPHSLEHYEDVAFADRLALLAADLLDGAVVLGLDRDLHLHRLEDHHRVPVLDLVADRDLDFPHVA